jgi:hypothetical protein
MDCLRGDYKSVIVPTVTPGSRSKSKKISKSLFEFKSYCENCALFQKSNKDSIVSNELNNYQPEEKKDDLQTSYEKIITYLSKSFSYFKSGYVGEYLVKKDESECNALLIYKKGPFWSKILIGEVFPNKSDETINVASGKESDFQKFFILLVDLRNREKTMMKSIVDHIEAYDTIDAELKE